MSTCTLALDGAKCGNPTVSTWEGACAHEHTMPDIDLCDEHEWLGVAMIWSCNQCAPDHECFVRLKVTGARP
jgi:hypothetical protein